MKKLYDKDEIWFSIVWIVIYVVGFANADAISESIGIPKLLTVLTGFIMITFLYGFIVKNDLFHYYGLGYTKIKWKNFGYFIPLFIISSVNLWNGVQLNTAIVEIILYIVSMCFVGFLEEVIFRGLLFKSMCKTNVTSAIIVSSITFGMGHIVNLLLGAPLFETMLQLIYASAIGFCYTVIFYSSGSILPCIVSHVMVNTTSIFAIEPTHNMQVIITIIQTMLSVGYGVWLLRNKKSK